MKNTIISVVAVAIVVVGGYVLITKKNTDTTTASDTATVQEGSAMPNGKKMAFAEFIKKGGSYECSVTQNVQNIASNGHVFIDGERIRGEFTTSVAGQTIDSSMITKDGMAYVWSSMAPMGMKMPVVKNQNDTSAQPMSGSYSFNAEQIGDYDCNEWKVDESKFALPSGITFQDLPTVPQQ